MSNLKKLVDYQNSLKKLDFEQLLEKLKKEIEEGQYHRFVSKNDILENEYNEKIKLVEIRLMEMNMLLKESLLNAIVGEKEHNQNDK